MEDNENKKNQYFELINKDTKTKFLIIRNSKVDKNINIKKEDKLSLTLVFDFNNLSDKLEPSKVIDIIQKFEPQNIIFKNCRVESLKNMYLDDEDLKLNELIISDELYSMSGNLDKLFPNFKVDKLKLKQFKINSNLQLSKFLEFIQNVGCEELTLEDIFIELIIKKDVNDKTYNEIEKFISFENGAFYILQNGDENNEKLVLLKKLKMIDCPLFAITEDTFNKIKDYKDISIDIDENSLINPSMITKFIIKDGYSNICFDLDSYRINENKYKDYTEYINDLFDIIIDGNHNFNKLNFKHFDKTKYEYITGENLTYIDESHWVLNDEEKKRKKDFEDYEKNIFNDKIKNNIKKLSNVKELIFDNCANNFIELILKFINSSKNNLDLFKIKKCGKEYFDLNNIFSLNIKNLILFDTPLIVDRTKKDVIDGSSNLGRFKGQFGEVENLTIKISSLKHYCIRNNLDYYNTLKILVELIKHDNFNQNLCFEMNALPVIMTYLIRINFNKYIGDKKKENEIFTSTYFPFIEKKEKVDNQELNIKNGIEKRKELVQKTFNLGVDFGNKSKERKIIIKKNNIKNKLENYENLISELQTIKKDITKEKEKKDYGSDMFNIDIDYKQFFNLNNIKNIEFEKCLFSRNKPHKEIEDMKETIINLIEDKNNDKNYTIDMKTINEIIFKNKGAEDISFLGKYLSLNENITTVNKSDFEDYLEPLKLIFNNLLIVFDLFQTLKNPLKVKIESIKERKEFYCLLCVYDILKNEGIKTQEYQQKENNNKKIYLKKKAEFKNKLELYFMKDKNENNEDVYCVFNYYYTSDNEQKIFGDFKDKEITYTENNTNFKCKLEYSKNFWDIITK